MYYSTLQRIHKVLNHNNHEVVIYMVQYNSEAMKLVAS